MDTCKYCAKSFKNLNLHYSKTKTCFTPAVKPATQTVYDFLGDVPNNVSVTYQGKIWQPIDLCETLTQAEKDTPASFEGHWGGQKDIYVYDAAGRLSPEPLYVIHGTN